MPRRVTLPGASELFRATESVDASPLRPVPPVVEAGATQATGRVRHDEKITVYVSSDELFALEHARLRLRAAGIVVDRGRLVRAAIADALSDLDDRGIDAALVARLGAQEE